jgi:hypothetical protein
MLNNMWIWLCGSVAVLVATLSGWFAAWRLTNKLRTSEQGSIVLNIERMKAEAELRESIRKDQLLAEQEKKLRDKEIEVSNAAISNPADNLNGAIKGK